VARNVTKDSQVLNSIASTINDLLDNSDNLNSTHANMSLTLLQKIVRVIENETEVKNSILSENEEDFNKSDFVQNFSQAIGKLIIYTRTPKKEK